MRGVQHLPSRLAIRLLSDREMLDAVRDWAKELDSVSSRGRGHGAPRLESRLQGQLSRIADRTFGATPRHQIAAALDSLFDGRALDAEVMPSGPQAHRPTGNHHRDAPRSALHALCLLGRRYLHWHRGVMAFRWERLLEIQEVTARIGFHQLQCCALGVRCLEGEGCELGAREPPEATLHSIFHGPLLPPVDEPIIDRLCSKGLVDIHRHESLARLPLLLWADLLERPHQLLETVETAPQEERRKVHEQIDLLKTAGALRGLLCWWLLFMLRTASRPSDPGVHKILEDICRALRFRLGRLGTGLPYRASPSPWESYNARIGTESSRQDAAAWLPGGGSRAPFGELALLKALSSRVFAADAAAPEVVWAGAYAYLVLQNLMTRLLVQPRHGKEGLERFVTDYARSAMHNLDAVDRRQGLIQAWRTGRVHSLEMRLSPSGDPRLKVRRLVEAAYAIDREQDGRRHWLRFRLGFDNLPDAKTMASQALHPNAETRRPAVGAVFHFLRESDRPTRTETWRPWRKEPRFSQLRRKLWDQGTAIRQTITTRQEGACILALDVANTETWTPIEVFAPVVRFLRSPFAVVEDRPRWQGRTPGYRMASLALTAHAGEDFHHLLSGVRAVHEAVMFLEMGSGDRLGHGLAVGLEPAQWRTRSGTSAWLPRGEWLDNLVWLATQLERHPDLLHLRSRLVEQALQLAGSIFKPAPPTGMALLEAARHMRTCCPLDAWEDELPERMEFRVRSMGSGSWRRFARSQRTAAVQRYGHEAKQFWLRWSSDPDVRRRTEQRIEVPLQEELDEAIRKVQDDVLRMLVQKNIAIEVNPTSNLTVGPIDSLVEHPIFRWRPLVSEGGGPKPVAVIGTDDPAVFASELMHEYAYLARAAESRGATRESVQRWLLELREASHLYSFFPSETGEQS